MHAPEKELKGVKFSEVAIFAILLDAEPDNDEPNNNDVFSHQ